MESNQNEYMNEKELSELVKISVSTLRVWRGKGKAFPFIKIEKRVLYKRSDINEYIEKNTTGGS